MEIEILNSPNPVFFKDIDIHQTFLWDGDLWYKNDRWAGTLIVSKQSRAAFWVRQFCDVEKVVKCRITKVQVTLNDHVISVNQDSQRG